MTKPLLLGEAPPPIRHSSAALDPLTCRRLLILMGGKPRAFHDSTRELARLFDSLNLCEETWTTAEAEQSARRFAARPVVVYLGRRVARSAGHRAPFYRQVITRDSWRVSIPHPSDPVVLEDLHHRERAGRALREAVLASVDRRDLDLEARRVEMEAA